MADDESFDWDDGNRGKIEERFDTETVEAIFDDEDSLSWPAYSVEAERRWGLLGATWDDRVLYIVYTWRGDKVRVIRTRHADPRAHAAYWAKRSKRR